MKKSYSMLGLMSGTSLDALDITYTIFTYAINLDKWSYKIVSCKSYSLPTNLRHTIQNVDKLDLGSTLILDKQFGKFSGDTVNLFLKEKNIDKSQIDAIASHGQTLLHQPENGFTYQIGCGETISTITDIQTINDFRSKDVVLGGQGAPLVPIGDSVLFSEMDSCLNLGGFSNISFRKEGKVIAFDICPVNIVLNSLASKLGHAYDNKGEISSQGRIIEPLLNELNTLEYYQKYPPKSLGTEWVNAFIHPILETYKNEETVNILRTFTEHIAIQLGSQFNFNQLKTVLCTGGGTFNNFLLERTQHHTTAKLIIPAPQIVEFKESILFGFLGALYLAKQNNILCTATGAKRNSIGGVLHLP